MWHCKDCDFDNDDLTIQCKICKIESPLNHHYRGLVAIKRGVFLDWRYENVTENEKLYSDFYNKEKVFVKDMDITELREHRETLSSIAFEARATLAAADDELRERKAKSNSKSKDWTLTPNTPDQISSDAINAVKVRKERMSKLDRMKVQLLSAGIDEVTVNEMIKNLERKATETNLKTVTFNKPNVEIAAVQVEKVKEATNTEPVAFNPAGLFGE